MRCSAPLCAAPHPGQETSRNSATEKGRPVSQAAFPVLRRLHIRIGRFRSFQTGGLSPDRVRPRRPLHLGTVANCCPNRARWVSHLRKMGSLSRIQRRSATLTQATSPLFPLSTAASRGCMCIRFARVRRGIRKLAGRPGLVVAGRLGTLAAGERRAGGPVGVDRAGQIRLVRLFPLTRLVVDLGRRGVDDVMNPAMP